MSVFDKYHIFNANNDNSLILNRNYAVVYASQHLLDHWGIAKDELIGKKCHEIPQLSFLCSCAGKTIQKNHCINKQVFQKGGPVYKNFNKIMANGCQKISNISAFPLKGSDGSFEEVSIHIKESTKYEGLVGNIEEPLFAYEAIFNNVPFSISYVNREMQIQKINPRMEKLIGRKSENVQGLHCYEVWGQYADENTQKGTKRICDDCKVQSVLQNGQEHTFQKKMGNSYVEITSSPVLDKKGNIIGALECGKDITVQKRAMQALIESEHRHFTLFNNNHSIMLLIDPETAAILDANPAACSFYGRRKEQLLAMKITDISTLTEDQVFEKMNQVMETGGQNFRSQHVHKNGEIRDVEVYSGPLPINDRLILCSIVHDITDRLKAEREEARSKAIWGKTFDAIADIITLQDKKMRIIQANKAAHTFFRVEDGGLIGKFCYDVFRGREIPCPGCPLHLALLDKSAHSSAIIKHQNLGKTFQVSTSPILDEKNEIHYIVHTARDITEQKQLEEELFQSHKMEAIGTLAGGIAHDFNNILTVINGFSELAKISIPHSPDNSAKDIDEVLKAGKRARELVKQILTFSRKKERTLQPLEPHLIVKEALKMLRSSLPATIIIKEDIDTECGSILVDPTNVYQIVVNLCINAYHAMINEKGVMSIKLCRTHVPAEDISENGVSPGPFIVLSVSDTGYGMTKQTIEQIFEPFFTTKESNKGTGLGLTVIKDIVKSYKGFIRVESEPGKGAHFHIHIPAITEIPASVDKNYNEADLPTGHERILLVDDEMVIIKFFTRVLEGLGYDVTAATDSRNALELVRANPANFNLIITDQTMPDLSGAEFAQEILKITPEMPLILCTGFSNILSEEEALAMGIKKYTIKPINRKKLAYLVRETLDGN